MVLASTNIGGAEMFVLNLIKNIDMNRFQVDVVVNFEETSNGIRKELESLGCKIFFLPYFKAYNYFGFVYAWKKFLNTHHYDIIHGHATNSASVYLKVAKEMGCATIAHCHSAGFRGNVLQKLLKSLFVKNLVNVADYWFACSEKAAIHLYGERFRDYGNYYTIPNAINVEKYLYNDLTAKKIRKSIGVSDDEFLCGHVGSFTTPKNHLFLLDVFKEVLKLKPKAKLVCCGSGELIYKIQDKARILGVLDRIIFTGVVKNINEYLMAMDIFIFPSVFEGFPISVIEAEASGLPIVMSEVISKEVDITDCVHRHSLEDSCSLWAKTICGISKSSREKYNKIVFDSKYNMTTSVNMIMSLYEEMILSK